MIIINKSDLVSHDELQRLKQIIGQLNPQANILCTTESRVELKAIMGTGLFSLSEAEQQPGWLAVPRGQEEPETEEYGISNFVFRSDRPFHPKRLTQALDGDMENGCSRESFVAKGWCGLLRDTTGPTTGHRPDVR